MAKILISLLGFLVILLLCTEEVRASLKNLWTRRTQTRRGKYLAYPLAVALALAAAGLILFSLWTFLAIPFSYD
jgi:hypothetical protein